MSWTSNPGYKFLDRYVRTLPGVENVSVFSESNAVSWVDGRQIKSRTRRTDGLPGCGECLVERLTRV